MMLALLLSGAPAQAGFVAGPRAPATTPERGRYERCLERATADPAAGVAEAGRWQLEGGGFLAAQCLGLAYAGEARWSAAAAAFEAAARGAEKAHDERAADYWQQAGNAWLADGNGAKARAALDAGIAGGSLTGLALGEAHLDRARALVAAGDVAAARGDLDKALVEAGDDPLAWLLSATLARRGRDLARARTDIAQALALGGDDPAVNLEAGNIAAASGDAAGARRAWQQAARLRPGSVPAQAAVAALAQFETP